MAHGRAARIGAALLLAVGLATSCTAADDDSKVASGLPVGTGVPAFNVQAVTGPQKGSTLCYV